VLGRPPKPFYAYPLPTRISVRTSAAPVPLDTEVIHVQCQSGRIVYVQLTLGSSGLYRR